MVPNGMRHGECYFVIFNGTFYALGLNNIFLSTKTTTTWKEIDTVNLANYIEENAEIDISVFERTLSLKSDNKLDD
jgi:hypothetical protein